MAPSCPIYSLVVIVGGIMDLSTYKDFDMFLHNSVILVYPSSTPGINPHFHAKFGVVDHYHNSLGINWVSDEDIEDLMKEYYNYDSPSHNKLPREDYHRIFGIMQRANVPYSTAFSAHQTYPNEREKAVAYAKTFQPSLIYHLVEKETTMEAVD